MKELRTGHRIDPRELETVKAGRQRLPHAEGVTHLQFRRFAGCPICNLHLRSLSQRHDELTEAGITEIVVFHSSKEEIEQYVSTMPFSVVADPSHQLYDEFGVVQSMRALTHPSAMAAAFKGVFSGVPINPIPTKRTLGLPADFLLSPEGVLLNLKYSKHADDQWSVDEVLSKVRGG